MMTAGRKYTEVAVVAVVIFLALLYRRYDAFTNPQLWAEAGTIILKEWETFRFDSIFIVYAGYFLVVQRLMAALIGVLCHNYLYIPLLYNLTAFLFTVAIGVGLWNSALRLKLKNRVIYATLFVLIPVGNELYMEMASLQWMTGIYLLNYLVTWDNVENERFYFPTLLLLLLSALSGPFSTILAPLVVLMIFLNRKQASFKRLLPLLIILLGGAVQLYCMKYLQPDAYSARVNSWSTVPADKWHLLKVFTKNISELFYFDYGWFPALTGPMKTGLSTLILIGLVVFFTVSYRRITDDRRYILVLAAALFFTSFIVTYWPKESLITALPIARYHFYPYICLGWLLVMAWDDKIKWWHMALYICFLIPHGRWLKTRLPDKNWSGQVKEYYEGKREVIDINPDGWTVTLPKRK